MIIPGKALLVLGIDFPFPNELIYCNALHLLAVSCVIITHAYKTDVECWENPDHRRSIDHNINNFTNQPALCFLVMLVSFFVAM